jgi:hypothetical protein
LSLHLLLLTLCCFLFFPDSVGNSVSFALNRLSVLRVIRADLLVASFSDVVDFVSSAFFLGAIGRKENENENEMRVRTTSSASFSPAWRAVKWFACWIFYFFISLFFWLFFVFPRFFVKGRSVIGFGGVIGSDEGLKG